MPPGENSRVIGAMAMRLRRRKDRSWIGSKSGAADSAAETSLPLSALASLLIVILSDGGPNRGLALKMNTSHPFAHQMNVIQLVGSPVQSSARFRDRKSQRLNSSH